MINKNRSVPHPGVYIKDAIEELGLSQSEFAFRTGLSIKNVSTIINGESGITFDVAVKLADYFHNSVQGWINLQTKYDLWLNETNRSKEYEEDWKIAKYFDRTFVSEYLEINFDSKNKENTINQLRVRFNVGSLKNLNHPDMYAFCKTSVSKDIDEKIIILRNAWISLAEQIARNIECKQFDKEKAIRSTKELKSLTLENPSAFVPKLKDILNEAGIKIVILPFLPGSNVSGVTKWIANENCVLIAINDCGKDAARIWFSIFHELGHAIQNHKRHMTISYEKEKIMDNDEIEANDFANNSLLDKNSYNEFVRKNRFDYQNIKQFAKEQSVADFVVIGRLQNDGIIPWGRFQDKKIKYSVRF